MAVERLGLGGMLVEMKQFYDRMLLMRAIPNFVHIALAPKKSDIPPGWGKSIEWRRMDRITINTTALTEGTHPVETVATFTNVQATISQYGQFSKISDILETQSFDPVIAEYAENYGETMGDVLDQVVRDVIVAGTNIQYASTAETLGAATGVGSGMFLDSAELREAVRELKRNDVKPLRNNKYLMIIHPDVTHDLKADVNVVDAWKDALPRSPDNPLFSLEIGDYMGVTFVETSNAKIESSLGLSGADVYDCLLIGREAYAVTELTSHQARMIIHPAGSGGHFDPLEQFSTVGWKAAITSAILNQNFMINVKVNASKSLAA